MRKLDKSLIALVFALVLWLAFAVGLVVEFGFPRHVKTHATTAVVHTDERNPDRDLYYLTVWNDDRGMPETYSVSPEELYSTVGPHVPIIVDESRSRFLNILLEVHVTPDMDFGEPNAGSDS